MLYLYEMHYHTPSTSYCGNVTPMEAFPHYSNSGYCGVVVTDHYYKEWFDDRGDVSWEQKIDRWLLGYRDAKEAAEVYNLNVILGMELRFVESANDYLVYGIDEQFLHDNQGLYEMTPKEFRTFADKHGLLFAQAHPFRVVCSPCEPKYLHAVEVYNGNHWHNNSNDLAEDFARDNQLIRISGSDCHRLVCACSGGVYLNKQPSDSKELAQIMFAGGISELYTSDEISIKEP